MNENRQIFVNTYLIEKEKYEKFVKGITYIPNISNAAMARIDLSVYDKCKEVKQLIRKINEPKTNTI